MVRNHGQNNEFNGTLGQILWFHVKHGETRMNDNQPCLRPCSWKTRHGNRLLGCFWGGEYLDIRDHRDPGYTRRTIFRFGVTFPNPIGWNIFDANLAPYTASLREQMLQVAGTLHFSQFRGGVSKRGKSEPSLFASQLQQATATATVSFPKDQRIAPSTTSHQCNGKCHFSRNVSKKLKTQD